MSSQSCGAFNTHSELVVPGLVKWVTIIAHILAVLVQTVCRILVTHRKVDHSKNCNPGAPGEHPVF